MRTCNANVISFIFYNNKLLIVIFLTNICLTNHYFAELHKKTEHLPVLCLLI